MPLYNAGIIASSQRSLTSNKHATSPLLAISLDTDSGKEVESLQSLRGESAYGIQGQLQGTRGHLRNS
jgi:hypothetical protein